LARHPQELSIAPAFEIAAAALDAIIAHARSVDPAECCGLLVGSGTRIEEAVTARNLAGDPTRFLIDPADHIAARRMARTRGRDVIGFYHSHPHSAAWPSATDLAEASYAEAVYLIVSLADGRTEARLFTIADGRATEMVMVCVG
jgi:proteasome lid subunit RPN8/RPN11